MASWLNLKKVGGNLSKVTSQLSNSASQITNFTKEVFTEGGEEFEEDRSGDLTGGMVNLRNRELEQIMEQQKLENNRMRIDNIDLKHAAEASQLQVDQVTDEYRMLLSEKEGELAELKRQLAKYQQKFAQELQNGSKSDAAGDGLIDDEEFDFASEPSLVKVIPQRRRRTTSSDGWFEAELCGAESNSQDDIHDGEPSNNLKQQVTRLQAEVEQLKKVEEKSRNQHQHDIVALQDAHKRQLYEIQNSKANPEESSPCSDCTKLHDLENQLLLKEEMLEELSREKVDMYKKLDELDEQHQDELKEAMKLAEKKLKQTAKDVEEEWGNKLDEVVWENEESISSLRSELIVMQESFREQEREKTELEIGLKDKTDDLEKEHMAVRNLEKKCEILDNKCEAMENELEEKENIVDELQTELKMSNVEQLLQLGATETQQAKVIMKEATCEQSTCIEEALLSVREQHTVEALQEKVDILKVKLEHSEEEKCKYQQQISGLSDELQRKKVECLQQNEKLNVQLEEKENIERNMLESKQVLQQREEEIRKLHTDRSSIIEERDEEISKLRTDLSSIIEERDEEISKLRTDLSSIIEERDEEIRKLRTDLSSIIEKTSLGEEQLIVLEAQVKSQKKTIDEMVQKKSETDDALTIYKNEASDLSEQCDKYRQKLEAMKAEQDSRVSNLQKNETAKWEQKLKDVVAEHAQSLQDMQREVDVTREALLEREKIICDNNILLAQMGPEILELRTKNESLIISSEENHKQRAEDQLQELNLVTSERDALQNQIVILEEHQARLDISEESRKNETMTLQQINAQQAEDISSLRRNIEEVEVQYSNQSHSDIANLKQTIFAHEMEIERLHNLQQYHYDAEAEKEQVLAILDEKTKENSQLRLEEQNLKRVLSEKEAALAKLQQDNKDLITQQTNTSMDHDDMHREAMQNVSRIVQEKDVEVRTLQEKIVALEETWTVKSNEKLDDEQKLKELIDQNECLASDNRALKQEIMENMNVSRTSDENDLNGELRAEYEQRQQELLERVAFFQQECNQHVEEISMLKRALNERSQILESVKSEMAKKDTEGEQLHSALEEKTMQLEYSSQAVAKLQTEVDLLKTQVENLRALEESWNSSSGSQQAQLDLLRKERDQILVHLRQEKEMKGELQQQAETFKKQSLKVRSDNERLQNHLLEVEEAHTQELMEAEACTTELKDRLAKLEGQVALSTAAAKTANEHANCQAENLSSQLHVLANQRDEAQIQLSECTKQLDASRRSVDNLQLALEQLQQDQNCFQNNELERCLKELKATKFGLKGAQEECARLKANDVIAKEKLEAVDRLVFQLEKREFEIQQYKEQTAAKDEEIKKIQAVLDEAKSIDENKVDRIVIKNMFLGYFSAPYRKRGEVAHLITSVLGCNQEELEKVMAVEGDGGGWLSFLKGQKQEHGKKDDLDQSFTKALVDFLQTESTPKRDALLPAETMAAEQQQKTKQIRDQQQTFPFSTPPRRVSGSSSPIIPSVLPNLPTLQTPRPKTNPSVILQSVLK